MHNNENLTKVEFVKIEIGLESLINISIEWWRLNSWLSKPENKQAVVARVVQSISAFLNTQDIEVVDLTGRIYDPGMAVDVIYTIDADSDMEKAEIIDETVLPIVIWKDSIVKYGQVVTKKFKKEI